MNGKDTESPVKSFRDYIVSTIEKNQDCLNKYSRFDCLQGDPFIFAKKQEIKLSLPLKCFLQEQNIQFTQQEFCSILINNILFFYLCK